MSAKLTRSKNILLTGPPGVGKTTIIKQVCDALKNNNRRVYGFYTEELRNTYGKREGFDVVTLDGKRDRLARTTEYLKPGELQRFKVGQYFVFPDSFEQLVLPLFIESGELLVLDEIGKMELFSTKFQSAVKKAFENNNTVILATVPIQRRNMAFVESLTQNPNNEVLMVDRNNRNTLVDDIILRLKFQ